MAVNPAALLDSVPKGLLIAGQWRAASDGSTLPVDNPATGEILAHVAVSYTHLTLPTSDLV